MQLSNSQNLEPQRLRLSESIGFRAKGEDLGFRGWGLGFRAKGEDLGFRGWGLGFRANGRGFRV